MLSIELPRPHRESFTKQYSLKWVCKEITAKIMELLKDSTIIPGMSSSFNSPTCPVLKPSRQYRVTTDYRNLNKVSPKSMGTLPDREEVI